VLLVASEFDGVRKNCSASRSSLGPEGRQSVFLFGAEGWSENSRLAKTLEVHLDDGNECSRRYSRQDSETDTKSSTLDLGLDSIGLLKRQGKPSVKNIASSCRGWLDNSPSEGDEWH
jgi:hypothetical protein